MKKSLIALSVTVAAMMANDQALISELSSLNIIQESQMNLIDVRDEGNLYMIKGEPMQVPPGQQKKSITFFLTKDKKVLITGNAIYTDTKERLSFPLAKSIIEGKEAFSYGKGAKLLYVFIDPECPYCKRFEQKMAKLTDQYTFKIYLFPLPFHPDAVPMSKWILAGKNAAQKGERLIALANGSLEYKQMVMTPELDQQLTETLNQQIKIAQEAEINATPTVLDSEMKRVNWPAL